jgi:hypothetical protein
MLSAVMLIGVLSTIELLLGVWLLALLRHPLDKAKWPANAKRSLLVGFGVLLASPALAPAGSSALIPLPLGVLLIFVRGSEDMDFLMHTSWFLLPSMIVTGIAFIYMARRCFPAVS